MGPGVRKRYKKGCGIKIWKQYEGLELKSSKQKSAIVTGQIQVPPCQSHRSGCRNCSANNTCLGMGLGRERVINKDKIEKTEATTGASASRNQREIPFPWIRPWKSKMDLYVVVFI